MCKLLFVSWLCCSIHRGTGPICIYSPVTMWQKSSNWLPALQNGFKNLNRISPEVHSDLSNSSVTNYMNISCRALLRSWATVNVISCLTCRDMSKWHIYLSPLTEYVCVCVFEYLDDHTHDGQREDSSRMGRRPAVYIIASCRSTTTVIWIRNHLKQTKALTTRPHTAKEVHPH